MCERIQYCQQKMPSPQLAPSRAEGGAATPMFYVTRRSPVPNICGNQIVMGGYTYLPTIEGNLRFRAGTKSGTLQGYWLDPVSNRALPHSHPDCNCNCCNPPTCHSLDICLLAFCIGTPPSSHHSPLCRADFACDHKPSTACLLTSSPAPASSTIYPTIATTRDNIHLQLIGLRG
jgi:hypothetical protein